MDYSKLPEYVQEQINKATQEKINFNQSSLSDVMGDTYSNILSKANRDVEKSLATLLAPDIQVGILRDGYDLSVQIHVTKPPFDSLGNKVTDPLTCEIWKSISGQDPDRIQAITGDVYSYDYVDKNVNKGVTSYTYTAILINQANGSRSQSKPFVISTVKNYELAKPTTPTITTNGEFTNRNTGTCSAKISFLPNAEDEYKGMAVFIKPDTVSAEDDDPALTDMFCYAQFNKDEAALVGGYDIRTIDGLEYGTFYNIRIVAVDYENGYSTPSDIVRFKAGDQTKPEKITNIFLSNISKQVEGVDHYGIKVTFKYPKANNDGVFDVQKIKCYRWLMTDLGGGAYNPRVDGYFYYDARALNLTGQETTGCIIDDEDILVASAAATEDITENGRFFPTGEGATYASGTEANKYYKYSFGVIDYASNSTYTGSDRMALPDPTEITTITVSHTNSDKIGPLKFDWTYTGIKNTRLIAKLKPEYTNPNKSQETTGLFIRKDFYNATTATTTFTQNEFSAGTTLSWEYPFGPSYGLSDKKSPIWSIDRTSMAASGNNCDVFLYEWTGSDPVNPTLTLIAQGEFEYRPVPIDLEDFKTIYDPATDTITISFGKWDSANETNITVNTAHTDRYHTVIWDDLVDEHNDGYAHYRTIGETSFKVGGGYSTASATFPATDLSRTFKGIKQYWGDHDDADNVYYSRNTASSTVVIPQKIGKLGAPTVTPGKRRFTVSWPIPTESYVTRIKSYKVFMASSAGGPWPGDSYPWDVSGEVAEISGNTIEIVKDLDGDAFPPEPVTRYFKILAIDKYLPSTMIPIWGSSSDTTASTSIDATPPVIAFISTDPDMTQYKVINASAVSITALVTDAVNNISSVTYRIYEVGTSAPAFVAASCVGIGTNTVTAVGVASAAATFTIPNNATYIADFQATDVEGNINTANYIFSRDTASATAITAGSATAVLAAGTNDGIILTINNYSVPSNFKEFIWEYSVSSSTWAVITETTQTSKVVSLGLSGDIYFRVKARKLHDTALDSAYTSSTPEYITLDVLKPQFDISFTPDINSNQWLNTSNYKTLTANIIVTDNIDMTGATGVIYMSFDSSAWTASGVSYDIRPASSTVASGVWTDNNIANGNHNIRFRIADKYGNYEFSQMFYMQVDSTTPGIINANIMNQTGTGCTNNRAIELRASGANFPCTNFNRLIYYYGSSTDYTILGETTDAVNGLFTTVLTKDFSPLNVKVIQEKKSLITSVLASSVSDSTIVDTVSPTLVITNIYASGTSNNAINSRGYTNASGIDVYFTATDAGTGIKTRSYSLDGGANWSSASEPFVNVQLATEGTVNLQIRAVDSATNASIVSRTFTRDITPPANITFSAGSYQKSIVETSWTNPTDVDFDYVEIRASATDGPILYKGNSNHYGIPPGSFDDMKDSIKIIYQTFDFAGNSSAFASSTITNTAPTNPSNVLWSSVPKGIRFYWDANTDADFDHYQYTFCSGTSFASASWVDLQGNSVVISVTDDATLDRMQRESNFGIWLGVKAFDSWGKESALIASSTTAGKALAITYVDFGNNPMQFVVWDSDTGTRVNNINNTDYMKLIDNDF